MGHKVLRSDRRALDELHEGDDLLIALHLPPDHGALHHRIMRAQHGLDLCRIDVEPGADDHLLGPPDDVEGTVLETGQIAGIEPAVRIDCLGGQIGGPVVAAHHVRPADVKLADFTVSGGRAIATDELRFKPRHDRADRMVRPRRVRPDAGDSRRAFGDAVAVEQGQAKLLLDTRFELEIERRASHRDQTKSTAVELRQACIAAVFEQALIGRRHAVEDCDTFLRHRLHQCGRIVFRNQAHGGTDHQGHSEQRDADDMRDRQHAILHIVGGHLAKGGGAARAEQQIAMGQHHPLWRARSAGRIDENSDLLCTVGFDRLGHGREVQASDGDAAKRADILHGCLIAVGMSGRLLGDVSSQQHAAGAAVLPDLIEFARREPRIDHDCPGIEPARGQEQAGQRDRILAHDHHAIAATNAELLQRLGDAPHRSIELAIGQPHLVVDQRQVIRRCLDVVIDHLVDAVRQAFHTSFSNLGRRLH